MVKKRILNTRNIFVTSENRLNIQRMFSKCGRLYDYVSYPRIMEVFTKLLNDLGITQLVTNNSFTIDDLYFDEPTLLINPYIENVKYTNNDAIRNIVHLKFYNISGYKTKMKNNRITAPFDGNINRLLYKGTPIIDYYNKRNVIIINFDILPQKPTLSIAKAVCDFIKEIFQSYNITIENTINSEERQKYMIKKNLQLFISHINKSEKSKNEKIIMNNKDILSYNNRISEKYRLNEIIKNELIGIKNFKKNVRKKFFLELEEIKKLEFVNKVTIQMDGILIDVGNLTLKHDKLVAYIGHMSFLITPTSIKILNLHSMNNLQHPHVYNNEPCFGTHNSGILQLLGQLDLKRLVFSLYQFLYTYTGNGCFGGSTLNHWQKYRLKEKKFDVNGKLLSNKIKEAIVNN